MDSALRSPQNGFAGAAGTWIGPAIGVTALWAELTWSEEDDWGRVAGAEHPAIIRGTAAHAAMVRKLTIRTCSHGSRPGPTEHRPTRAARARLTSSIDPGPKRGEEPE